MNTTHKIIGVVFALFFIYAAAVQINDIDPWLWVGLYALATAASILFVLGRLKKVWGLILALAFAIIAITHWPPEFEGVALQDGMKTMNIELGRESLGMGISAVVMLVYYFLSGKKHKA